MNFSLEFFHHPLKKELLKALIGQCEKEHCDCPTQEQWCLQARPEECL